MFGISTQIEIEQKTTSIRACGIIAHNRRIYRRSGKPIMRYHCDAASCRAMADGGRKNVPLKVRQVRQGSGRNSGRKTHAETRRAWRALLHKRTKENKGTAGVRKFGPGPLFLRGRFWKCEAPPWKSSVSPFSARSVFCATGRGERGAGGLVPWAGGAYLIRIRGRSFFIARLFPNPHCSGCARCRGWSGRCAFRRGGGRGGRRAKGKRDGWFGGRDGG